MRKLFNQAECCFCGFGELNWAKEFTPDFFVTSKKKHGDTSRNLSSFFWGLKDSIFPYILDCYHSVELERCSVSW